MENDIHALIEDYLEGSLSETERREVEQRLATDAAFRAEMEVHRGLQEHLGDPGEVRLRTELDQLFRKMQPETPPAKKPGRFWPGALVLLVVGGLLGWWWWKPAPDAGPGQINTAPEEKNTPAVPPVRQNTTPAAPASPLPPPAPQKTQPPVSTPQRPIAMADPADFVPNSTLEARLGGVRGNGVDDIPLVEITWPATGSALRLQNGKVNLRILGTVSTDTLPANRPLQLFIYSNRPEDWVAKKALLEVFLPSKAARPGVYSIDVNLPLELRPGLYYPVIRQLYASGDGYATLWVGKITVR